MPHLILLSLLAFFTAAPALATDAVEEERLYRETQKALLEDPYFRIRPGLMSNHRLKIALDAIEDTLATGRALPLAKILPDTRGLPPKELARWFRLSRLVDEATLVRRLSHVPSSPGLLYELLELRPLLKTEAARAFVDAKSLAQGEESRRFGALASVTPSSLPEAKELRDLFFETPDLSGFQGGAYAGKPRLFLFCRSKRQYPCLMALKDKDDKPVRSGTSLWLQPGLAYSGQNLPFNKRNGNTPSGVYRVNGVMPTADVPYSYGSFRRLILDFVPASEGEAETKKALPKASEASLWWREAVVARDMGRNMLRIHGTGKKNNSPSVPFYPFIATLGCVAQKEMKYGSTTYIDQRRLLDQLMRVSGLQPKYENETAIRALFYVVNIDGGSGPVTAAELAKLGIK